MIEVTTGCRLHFGLMELCSGQPLQYAGLGLMVSDPNLHLQLTGTPQRSKPAIDLCSELVAKVSQVIDLRRRFVPDSLFPQRISLASQLPMHHGLGSGTQLACAVALGLEVFDQQHATERWDYSSWQSALDVFRSHDIQPNSSITYSKHAAGSPPGAAGRNTGNGVAAADRAAEPWLARLSGRGLRSAIGLAGFLSGGMLLDHGVSNSCGARSEVDEKVDRSEHSLAAASHAPAAGNGESGAWLPENHVRQALLETLPTDDPQATMVPAVGSTSAAVRPIQVRAKTLAASWRLVLARPQANCLVSGAKESQLMKSLGTQPNADRQQMFQLAERVFDNCHRTDCFAEFCSNLDHYLELAGGLFAKTQGGLYNGPEVTAVAACAQASGLRAVGQTSWGPTIFGFCESQAEAEDVVERMQRACPVPLTDIRVTRPLSQAARFRISPRS